MGKYKQERKDLFKDMSGGYNAMGDSNKPSPIYNYGGNSVAKRYSQPMEKQGPLHGNAFGDAMQKTGGDYDKAKSMLNMVGDPNKKMDRLSAKHKSLYDRFEMGQTSEKEEKRMFRLEDRMDKVGKKIESKKSPLNQGKSSHGKNMMEINKFFKDNSSIPSDASSKTKRKAKKANKTVNQISKLQNKRSSVKTIYEDTDSGPSTRAVKVRSADSNPGSKEKRKTRKLLKTLKQVKGSSPLNQGVKEMSDAELKKMLKEKGIKPGDIKSKKALSISEKPKDKKKKDIIKSKNKKVIKATKKKMTTARGKTTSTKKTMTTGRGKTTKSPLNQGKKEVKTLGEKETRQDRRAGKDNLRQGYFGIGSDDPKKTKLQRDAKERTSDPDYKKPKAKTLKKSPSKK